MNEGYSSSNLLFLGVAKKNEQRILSCQNQNHKMKNLILFAITLLFISCQNEKKEGPETKQIQTFTSTDYADLETLFKTWREFEKPPLFEGAPDYRVETFTKRQPEFKELQSALNAIDTTNWPIEKQVDWMIVWAEMNGYDFNQRVLQPWKRDPAYYKSVWSYKSDVPAHEGPTHHGTTEIWTYSFP